MKPFTLDVFIAGIDPQDEQSTTKIATILQEQCKQKNNPSHYYDTIVMINTTETSKAATDIQQIAKLTYKHHYREPQPAVTKPWETTPTTKELAATALHSFSLIHNYFYQAINGASQDGEKNASSGLIIRLTSPHILTAIDAALLSPYTLEQTTIENHCYTSGEYIKGTYTMAKDMMPSFNNMLYLAGKNDTSLTLTDRGIKIKQQLLQEKYEIKKEKN